MSALRRSKHHLVDFKPDYQTFKSDNRNEPWKLQICRGSVAASKTRAALAAVFDVAPNCIDAKLLQAELMLDDKDYGGQILACPFYDLPPCPGPPCPHPALPSPCKYEASVTTRQCLQLIHHCSPSSTHLDIVSCGPASTDIVIYTAMSAITVWYLGVVAMMGILLKGQPDNVQALYLRGKSYFYMDDQSMAKRHFGEALKYDPEHKKAKAEFTKVRTLYKKKAQVSQPHALLGRLHQCHADLLIQMGLLLLLTHHFKGIFKSTDIDMVHLQSDVIMSCLPCSQM